jgi:hypothetical protein
MIKTTSEEIYHILKEKLGREEARKIANAFEIGLKIMEKREEDVVLEKDLVSKKHSKNYVVT